MNISKNEWRYGDQDQIKVQATADLAAGQVLAVGANVVGIVLSDTPNGGLANIATSGVWEMKKGAAAIAPGVSVYWNAATQEVTATAGSNPWLGVTVHPTQPAYDNSVYVQLRQRSLATA